MSVPAAVPTTVPTPLNPAELVELTRFVAAEVRTGAYRVGFELAERWHQRIYRDQRVDIWVITWLTDQGTQLHDHGGSSGAFTVVSGTLSEAVHIGSGPGAGSLRERRHVAGRNIGFGPHHVHDVRNVDAEPAISVHAYSAPLTSMNFYDLENGQLTRFASLDTDHPETPPPG